MFTAENLMHSATLRSLAVEASLMFPQTFRPFQACGVFETFLKAGASQRVLKIASTQSPRYVAEWIRLLNAEESIDAMIKEGLWKAVRPQPRALWEAIKAFEWDGYCPFLHDELNYKKYDEEYEEQEEESVEVVSYGVRKNQLRFTFDGHWYDSDGCMVIPDLGGLVKTDNFEQHSRLMAEQYRGFPVVLFSRSYEFEGCWSSWSCGTKIDPSTHRYCMAVPLVNGALVWEAWSFAPMWEGAKTIGLGFFDQEEQDEQQEEEEVLPPRFRGKVVKAAKKALHKGKKIKLAA